MSDEWVMVPRDLLQRVDAALQRHLDRHAPMRIPVDQTDSDLVQSDVQALIAAPAAPQQAEPVAKIIRNDSGQVRMVDDSGEPFDMFAHVGQSYYAHPPAAEVQRLREALKPFAAIDLTTNQAVDAMDVLRARRALRRE